MDETGGDQGQKNRLKGEMIAWEIWKEQCRAMHYGDNTMPEAVIHVGINLAEDTWRTRQSTVAEPARRPIATQHRWSKPELKVIKINCDATWVAETRKGGTGVVARNWEGRIIIGRNTISKDTSAKNLEANAIFPAVELTIHHKWKEVIIESNAQQIVQMLIGTQQEMDWELKNLLKNIIEMAKNVSRFQWKFVRRSANQCANWVASKCRQMMCPNN